MRDQELDYFRSHPGGSIGRRSARCRTSSPSTPLIETSTTRGWSSTRFSVMVEASTRVRASGADVRDPLSEEDPLKYGWITVRDRRTGEMIEIADTDHDPTDPGDEGTPCAFKRSWPTNPR
jgi:hypothetical protein